MAKLKAEATAASYDAHGVPLRSRLFANIAGLNTLGSAWPGLTNVVLSSGLTRPIFNRIGIAPKRGLPLLAAQPFRRWYYKHNDAPNPGTKAYQGEVILFDDTFMNFNTPRIGQAAVKVLEAAGFRVRLVDKRCCGRPAISKGLLDTAKAMAKHNIAILAPYAKRGIPIIGCEPSCISALIDDYRDFFPGEDSDAVARMAMTIDQFLVGLAEQGKLTLKFDDRPRSILFHGHCHQKSLMGTESIRKMLCLIPGATVSEIQSGCCGVAGSFGYEAEHYDLSLTIGEDRLLPAVREASAGTIIAASGTSCREQIEHNTDRQPLHPIEILLSAIEL